MTSSDKSTPAPPSFKEKCNETWNPPKFIQPTHWRIEAIARELELRFGGVGKEPKPAREWLEETKQRLDQGNGDLSRLEPRHRRALPWILWDDEYDWSERRELVDNYFAWADSGWKTSVRRLWKHYLLNMDPASYATCELARWVGARRDRLTDSLRGFSERWDLFDPPEAIRRAAQVIFEGQDITVELEQLDLDRSDVLRSSFMLRVAEMVGQSLRTKPPVRAGIAGTLKRWLAPLGENPIQAMQGGPQALRNRALKALVEGLVAWAESKGGAAVDETLDLIHTLIGDPRLHPARWNSIASETRQTVETWLSKITLEAFFRVMAELQTDNPQQVAQRQVFWHRYLQFVSRAWLIVARDGTGIAEKALDRSFGRFSNNTQRDHAGLLLQIRNLVVLEMNKNGSTLFWMIGDTEMPGFFQKEYSRDRLLQLCNLAPESRLRLTHQGDWQTRYENEILRRTGIAPH